MWTWNDQKTLQAHQAGNNVKSEKQLTVRSETSWSTFFVTDEKIASIYRKVVGLVFISFVEFCQFIHKIRQHLWSCQFVFVKLYPESGNLIGCICAVTGTAPPTGAGAPGEAPRTAGTAPTKGVVALTGLTAAPVVPGLRAGMVVRGAVPICGVTGAPGCPTGLPTGAPGCPCGAGEPGWPTGICRSSWRVG